MKKIIFLLVLNFTLFCAKAQYLGISGGGSLNTIYSKSKNTGTNYTHYPKNYGYSFGLSCDVFNIAMFPVRISGSFHQFHGHINGRFGGMGGGSNFVFDYSKQQLAFGIHILNRSNETRVQYSFGIEYNYMLQEKLTGSKHYSDKYGSYTETYNEANYNLNARKTLALITSFGIKQNLSPNIYIIPQVRLHFGLKREFVNIDYFGKPKAFRFFFELGVFRKIKKQT